MISAVHTPELGDALGEFRTRTHQRGQVGFRDMNITLGHAGVQEMSYHKGAERFAALMKERTEGAVVVRLFPDGQLGSEKGMLEQVRNGALHISLTGPSMLAQFKGWGPIGVLSMPYLLKGDTEDELRPRLMRLARGPLMAELNERAAKESGIRILDMGWWYGERHLTTKSKQIARPEDIQGLTIRTMESPVARAAMAALGAATIPMPVSELYTALRLGTVEGQENTLNTIYAHKFFEVQKYLALTGHMVMNLVLVTNDRFFQGLSPALREIFVRSMQDAGDFESEMQIAMNKKNLQNLKAEGMIVTNVKRAEFAERTRDAWQEFAAMFGPGFYERVLDAAQ